MSATQGSSKVRRDRDETIVPYLIRRHRTACNWLKMRPCSMDCSSYRIDIPKRETGGERYQSKFFQAGHPDAAKGQLNDVLNDFRHKRRRSVGHKYTVTELARRWQHDAKPTLIGGPGLVLSDRKGSTGRVEYKPSAWLTIRRELDTVWIPALGERPMDDVTGSDVQRVLDGLKAQGLAINTIYNKLNAFRVLCRFAMSNRVGCIAVSPCGGLEVSGKASVGRAYIESVDAMLMYVGALERPLDRAVWAAAGLTALRSGELRGQLTADVDLDGRVIHVHRSYDPKHHVFVPTKNRNWRNVPILDELVPYIEPYVGEQGLLFPGEGSGRTGTGYRGESPFSDQALQDRAVTAWRRANLPKLPLRDADNYHRMIGETWPTLHVFRHTFASHMIAAGVDLLTVADWMGHNPEVLRKVYRHRLESYDRAQLAKANEYLAAARLVTVG